MSSDPLHHAQAPSASVKPDSAVTAEPWRIQRVGEPGRVAAARCLMGPGAALDPEAGEKFLLAARMHHIPLDGFWVSVGEGGEPRETALAVPGAGRTATYFTSTPSSTDRERELAAVLRQCEGALSGVVLSQALLAPHEYAAHRSFTQAGFTTIATLFYLSRPMPRSDDPCLATERALPPDVTMRVLRAGEDELLARALQATYIDTSDCPELCGLREMRDVIASHRAAGVHDPRMWWVLEHQGRPEGALLLNPSPAQDAIELVYIGVSPALRGRGVGRAALVQGLRAVSRRRERTLTCAVDERNASARALYARLGFTESSRRLALIKPRRA